ncbi:MAG: M23 family metallopeptidase [Alphaproteobacteria bacterium]|nr:M23 family metallopeptidase [Alphaproteobacteria bacterium]
MQRAAVFLFVFSLVAANLLPDAAVARPDNLLLPLDCTPGQDCWVVRYVDHDPGPDTRDYACGPMTGDGHKGTDFAVRDLAAITTGIDVLAAAGGRVAAVRDGMEDRLVDAGDVAAVGGRECGNGVRIDHGDGWMTLYCHLRRGSTKVLEGDRVVAGQPLGLVGISGQTSFPHLHFDIRHNDRPVDPFVGVKRTASCGPGEAQLWSRDVRMALHHRPPLLVNSGITATVPDKDDTRKGWHRDKTLPSQSPSLTLWVDGYWFEQGDKVAFRLEGPERSVVIDRSLEVGQSRQRWFSFASAPRPFGGWPEGNYRGEIRVQRPGRAIDDVIGAEVNIN